MCLGRIGANLYDCSCRCPQASFCLREGWGEDEEEGGGMCENEKSG